MKKKRFISLLNKYVDGKTTDKESKFVETYYAFLLAKSKAESVNDEMTNQDLGKDLLNNIWNEIHKQEQSKSRMISLRSRAWRVAAVLVALIGIGVLFYTIKTRQERVNSFIIVNGKTNKTDEIRPGGNKAILTLANGKKVLLDSASNGSLAKQGNINIIKLNSGQLTYKQAHSGNSAEFQPAYNTLYTPRGGQYGVILPDGTKVWLNAASSLHYPVAFTGNTRTVEIQGEGYFDIKPNPQKPFIVKVNNMKIEVLGTQFDVNAYKDDGEIKTTLAGGSIRVQGGIKSVLLKPGENVIVDDKDENMKVGVANVAAAIAWKNGLFYFDNTNIKEIMAQVSRWYDVNVKYETNELSDKSYSGVLPRYSDVNTLLKMLEMTGTVHFEIKGRTIFVMD